MSAPAPTSQATSGDVASQSADANALANADYLARCQPQVAVCPPTNGGITQNYAFATTLYYNLPTADNAMLSDLLVTCTISLAFATGTAATYAANASMPWGLFDRIIVTYNGTQAQLRPILLKYYWYLRGYGSVGSMLDFTVTGRPTITTVQNILFASTVPAPGAVVAAGNVAVNWAFRVPLRALHELNPAGVLPIMGQGTKGQVAIVCQTAALGPDPLLNVAASTGGSGNAITVNGGSTVKCEAIYMDGTTLWSSTPLILDLVGEPTAQYYIDLPLTPLVAGVVNRQAITTLLQHYLVLTIIVDGNQSNKFALTSNIAELEFDKDSVGRNPFYIYGASTNVSVIDFFERVRQYLGQDLDEGIIPWVVAWLFNQQAPDLREGVMVLNMTQGGWTDTHYGAQLTTINGVANAPARFDTYLVSLNPEPLIKA